MKNIEVCVRAIIQSKGKFLVCWHKEKQYYFFPGGHVDFGETAEKALVRELKEELNIVVKKLTFIGIIENIYIEKRDKHKEHRGKRHQISLVFNVSAKKIKDKSLEDHIDFILLGKKDFQKEKVLPISLQKNIIKWLKDKKIFWISQAYKK